MEFKLYGMPGSLYTGKARSYLIKQGIEFDNRAVGEERFRAEILGKIGRWIIPVVETPDGELIQDGSDIITWFERRGLARLSAYPNTPRHRVISQIFELFGGEGLLRPAMHYRWNFDETNLAFLSKDFVSALAPGASAEDAAATFGFSSGRMRKAMTSFGVSEQSIPKVEAAYETFLDLFNAHLANSPYLLGGRPTLGDYGLIGPLYAHLGRDPYPADMMKRRAHRVWRWVERMNAAGQDAGDYGSPAPDLFADDAVPETLMALLRFVAQDYLPEIVAAVGFTNDWLAARPEIEAGTNGLARASDRVLGQVEFLWREVAIKVSVMPYRLYLLQQVQDAAQAGDPAAQAEIGAMLKDAGLAELLTLKTTRRVERVNHLEVWGASL
jgi:glutathione S-transferase